MGSSIIEEGFSEENTSENHVPITEEATISEDGKKQEDIAITKPFWKSVQFWVGTICMVWAGATNPLVSKSSYFHDSYPCPSDEDCELKQFDGFISLAFGKYIYQVALAAVAYYLIDYVILFKHNKTPTFSQREDMERSFPKGMYWKFFITAIFDCTFTLTSRAATMFVRASTISMLGSLQIVTAVFADMICIRRALTVGKLAGVMVIILGMLVYGIGASMEEEDEEMASNPPLGIGLAIISAIARGCHSSVQGMYMKNHRLPPLKVVMFEGCYSTCILTIVTIILQLTSTINVKEEFWMIVRNMELFWTIQLFSVECFIFNGGAAVVGKFVSGLFRMILARMTAVLMWSAELILGWTPFTWMALTGWLILFIGVDFYGGVYPKFSQRAPWWFRPLLCCKSLIPPDNSILSVRQQARYQPSIASVALPDGEVLIEESNTSVLTTSQAHREPKNEI